MNKIITIVTYLLLVVLVVLLAASSASLFLKKQKVDTMLSLMGSAVFSPISVSGDVVSISGRTITIKSAQPLLSKNIPAPQGTPVSIKEDKNVPIVVEDKAQILFFDSANTGNKQVEIKLGDIKVGYHLFAQVTPSSSGELKTNVLNMGPNRSSK
jgi:hypothetical protein